MSKSITGTASAGPVDLRAASQRLSEDNQLLGDVLRPYYEHTTYLKSATVTVKNGLAVAKGEFSIDQPCYIQDTGHFNAVEFNICYNQLVYFLIAKSIKEGAVPAFEGWTVDDYWERQLPSILITRFRSVFRAQIDSSSFHGEVAFSSFTRSTVRKPVLFIDTTSRFWDDKGGRADGDALLALLDPPAEKAWETKVSA